MGNEGHTLSLFPGTKALHADGRIAVHNWVGKLFTERITLTAPAACAASEILFMVTGGDKALALKRSEEHTSELQSRLQLVCRLLLEKKKKSYESTSLNACSRMRHTHLVC